MKTPNTKAGYIVHNDEAIYGFGDTIDTAWDNFVATMEAASTKIVEADDEEFDPKNHPGNWTRETDYKIRAASSKLMAKVKAEGGAVAWQVVSGVASTMEE